MPRYKTAESREEFLRIRSIPSDELRAQLRDYLDYSEFPGEPAYHRLLIPTYDRTDEAGKFAAIDFALENFYHPFFLKREDNATDVNRPSLAFGWREGKCAPEYVKKYGRTYDQG